MFKSIQKASGKQGHLLRSITSMASKSCPMTRMASLHRTSTGLTAHPLRNFHTNNIFSNIHKASSEQQQQQDSESKASSSSSWTRRILRLFKYIFVILPTSLVGLTVLSVSLMKLILHLYQNVFSIEDPSSTYYNKTLSDKLRPVIQLMQGIDRYIRSALTIYTIAFDYFLVLIREPYNPAFWFRPYPEKNDPAYLEEKHRSHQRNANRLLQLCMDQKGVYIKLGQFISSMIGLIPDEYIETLAVLRDRAPQISYEDVRMVIHQDFGKPIEELFDYFETKPIASASIAQVHRAITKDGQMVAVKVQYPYVRSYFEGDMRTNDAMSQLSIKLYYMQEDAENIDTLLELNNQFNKELETGLLSELDFRHEAKNAKIAYEHMQNSGRTDVYIPQTISQLTSQRVLTMEFIENACNANNVKAIKEMGFDIADISERIMSACSEQLFIHGFIQADPHPSNIFVRKDPSNPSKPQIVLLDHGLYKKFTDEFRVGYAKFWRGVVLGDEKEMKEYCDSLGIADHQLYASMLMMQSFDSLGDPKESLIDDVWEEFDKAFAEKKDEFMNIYKKMPAEMLFVSRADNILRALNQELGAKVNRFTVMARAASKGISLVEGNKKGMMAKFNSWRGQVYFEFRLWMIAVQSWFYTNYLKWFGVHSSGLKKLKEEHEKTIKFETEVDVLETPKHFSTKYQ